MIMTKLGRDEFIRIHKMPLSYDRWAVTYDSPKDHLTRYFDDRQEAAAFYAMAIAKQRQAMEKVA